jgi:hypothetical protein
MVAMTVYEPLSLLGRFVVAKGDVHVLKEPVPDVSSAAVVTGVAEEKLTPFHHLAFGSSTATFTLAIPGPPASDAVPDIELGQLVQPLALTVL